MFAKVHPVIRKLISTLTSKLSDVLDISNSHLETFCLLIIGIANARTINLSHISSDIQTQKKIENTYRRLQRFFQHVDLGLDWSAQFVVRMLGLFVAESIKYLLVDRKFIDLE